MTKKLTLWKIRRYVKEKLSRHLSKVQDKKVINKEMDSFTRKIICFSKNVITVIFNLFYISLYITYIICSDHFVKTYPVFINNVKSISNKNFKSFSKQKLPILKQFHNYSSLSSRTFCVVIVTFSFNKLMIQLKLLH